MYQTLTTVFTVEEIEPSLEFWVDRLGFERVLEVPDGERLAFVLLGSGTCQVMFQTKESVLKEGSPIAEKIGGQVGMVYVKVDDVDALMPKLDGCDIVVPRKGTFYGMTEVGVREPGGQVVVFASESGE